MTTDLRISTGRATDGTPWLSVTGEIDLSNASEFAKALTDATGPDHRLLVDLTEVEYLDSAALAALFTHADRIEVQISPLNESLLTYSGLAEVTRVQVVPSEVDAGP